MLNFQNTFKIEKNKIYSKYQCSTEINMRDFKSEDIIETSSYFELPGVLQFYVPEFNNYTQFTVNYRINLNKTENTSHIKNIITITYNPNQLVIFRDYKTDEMDMGMLTRLLQGRIKYVKDPRILVNMLYENLPGLDLVHLELIVSNMFRNKDDNTILSRLSGNYKNSVILGQNKQPFTDSWYNALLFLYIDKAIKSGLVGGKPMRRDPIELIANENFGELYGSNA